MERDSGATETIGVHAYLAVLRRHKWIALQAVLLVPLAALYFSLRQTPQYEASSEVLLQYQNLASALSGIQDTGTIAQNPARFAETQAKVARAPELAQRVLAAVPDEDASVAEFLASSSVAVDAETDVLELSVTDTDPDVAAALATAYARQYVRWRLELDTQAVVLARRGIQQRLEDLRAEARTDSELYDRLVESEQQLRTMEALQTSNASLLRPADEAEQVVPQTFRNALLGVFLGLVLGIGLAFLREALDTRVRKGEDVAEALGAPLLARIPTVARKHRRRDSVSMLDHPAGASAEAFRVLRTNLEFVSVDRPYRMLMVTSAGPEEGKTTTATNLAVALARSGRRVVLVDVDLRRPAVDARFGIVGKPGLTDVALGHLMLDDALIPIPLADGDGEHEGNGAPSGSDVLTVLTTGPLPPDVGEFVGSGALARVLGQLKQRFEVVVVDVPPLVGLGDALGLSAHADGIVIVARLGLLRRPALRELRRLLQGMPAPTLGIVLVGGEPETQYGYGYGYAEKLSRRRARRLTKAGKQESA